MFLQYFLYQTSFKNIYALATFTNLFLGKESYEDVNIWKDANQLLLLTVNINWKQSNQHH